MQTCRSCGGHVDKPKVYCDNNCQSDYQYRQYIDRWLEGQETGVIGRTKQLSGHVRRFIRETMGSECSSCGWDERHPTDGAVLTEVDHIDGDVDNTTPYNLRVLCPNCHAKTPTFRARNKVSKRDRRPCS